MLYGHSGTMRARPGQRDQVIAILLRGADGLRAAGCRLFVVGTLDDDPDLISVYEVWESQEHHQASLQLPEVRAAIAEAMPMLTGEFTSQQTAIVGGLGVETQVR